MQKPIMAALILGILAGGNGMALAGNSAYQIIRYQVISNHAVASLDVKTIMNSGNVSSLGKDPNASTAFPYRTKDKDDYRVSASSQIIQGERVVTLTFTDSK